MWASRFPGENKDVLDKRPVSVIKKKKKKSLSEKLLGKHVFLLAPPGLLSFVTNLLVIVVSGTKIENGMKKQQQQNEMARKAESEAGDNLKQQLKSN